MNYRHVCLQDSQGQTAIHVACQNGHKSVSRKCFFTLLTKFE